MGDFRTGQGGAFAEAALRGPDGSAGTPAAAAPGQGSGRERVRARRAQAVGAALTEESRLAAAAALDGLGVAALAALEARGAAERDVRLSHRLHLKAGGAGRALPVRFGTLGRMRAAFARAHRARFGADPGEGPLEIHAVAVEPVGEPPGSGHVERERPVQGDRRSREAGEGCGGGGNGPG